MKFRYACLVSTMLVAVSLIGLLMLTMLSSANAAPVTSPPIWIDEFDGPPLDSRWSWMNEDPAYWSLTARPGFLRITTTEQLKNDLYQSAPPGDFIIQTSVLITPSENFQQAGLMIYLDEDNQLSLKRGYADPNVCPTCAGNAIYFDILDDGQFTNYVMTTTVQGETHLRLIRTGPGNTFHGSVSENNIDWTEFATHTVAFVPTTIGLRAASFQAAASEIPADFDYFFLADQSHKVLLPLVLR